MYDVTSLTITGLHVIQRISLYFSQCIVRTSVPWNQAFKYADLWFANLRFSIRTKGEQNSKYCKYALFKISSIQHLKNSVLMCWSMAQQHIWPFDFILQPGKILKRFHLFHLVKSLCSADSEESEDLKFRDNMTIMLGIATKITEFQINL